METETGNHKHLVPCGIAILSHDFGLAPHKNRPALHCQRLFTSRWSGEQSKGDEAKMTDPSKSHLIKIERRI